MHNYDPSEQELDAMRVEQVARLDALNIVTSADTFAGPITAAWTVINYNNSMGWGFSGLVADVIFLDQSFYVMGTCTSEARGRPPMPGYPVEISYDQNSDVVKWGEFLIQNATGAGIVDIKYDITSRKVLMRLKSRQRNPQGGNFLIEGAFVVAS